MKSKLVGASDLHLLSVNPVCRKDSLVDVQWDKLKEIFLFAARNQADVLIAGDLTDKSNNYWLINRLSALLRDYKGLGVDVYAVFGQHDMKYRNKEDTNLDILSSAGLVTILGSTPEKGAHFNVYGASWMGEVPKANPDDINLLVIHSPLSPAALFHGHNYINPSQFIEDHPEYNLILCGDVHRTFIEESGPAVFLNSGPLLREEADEYYMIHKPGFFFIDMNDVKIEFREIKHRPSSEVITRMHIERKKIKEKSAAIADTAHFLDELKRRTSGGRMMNIQERIKAKISSGTASEKAKSILECLLNEKDLSQWLTGKQERTQ